MQGCRHHVYAPQQKSFSLGRRTSSHPQRRRCRTFKVSPSEMPWAYVCRVPRSPRCHRARAQSCRGECLVHPPLTLGRWRPGPAVSNRRGNPTLTSLRGEVRVSTLVGTRRFTDGSPRPACGGRCAPKDLPPKCAGHSPGSLKCLRAYVRPRPRPRDDRRPRPRPDPTARRGVPLRMAPLPCGLCDGRPAR